MKKKSTYRIRNWSEYNASLKQRGSLTVWVSKDAIENWRLFRNSRGAPHILWLTARTSDSLPSQGIIVDRDASNS
jgi:hypothetical protein